MSQLLGISAETHSHSQDQTQNEVFCIAASCATTPHIPLQCNQQFLPTENDTELLMEDGLHLNRRASRLAAGTLKSSSVWLSERQSNFVMLGNNTVASNPPPALIRNNTSLSLKSQVAAFSGGWRYAIDAFTSFLWTFYYSGAFQVYFQTRDSNPMTHFQFYMNSPYVIPVLWLWNFVASYKKYSAGDMLVAICNGGSIGDGPPELFALL
ncbi:hypothetical protein IW262DRAFT_1290980 [Armillaria fumosa]|nr:hypothetical protein IW262DRAFT_1290980 [Armillaria fumosa]